MQLTRKMNEVRIMNEPKATRPRKRWKRVLKWTLGIIFVALILWGFIAYWTSINKAFSAVIRACAERENTWINRDIIDSYTRLNELGHAHSVEACKENRLAGGLYGVAGSGEW